MEVLDFEEKFKEISTFWHPHRVGKVNDMQVLLAKLKGEFVWHEHEEEDEYFQVLEGTLIIDFDDRQLSIGPGQSVIVPRGMRHRPRTKDEEEVKVILFEKLSTRHTGNTPSSLTQHDYPEI